jgi:hypothetical protein
MSRKQEPRMAGMRPSVNDAGHRNGNPGGHMNDNEVAV